MRDHRNTARVRRTGGGRPAAPAIACLLLLLTISTAGAGPVWNRSLASDATSLAISGEGSHIAVAAEWIHLYSAQGDLLWRRWSARRVAISSDGRYIAAATHGSVRLVDTRGITLWERDISGDPIALAMTGSGMRIAAGTSDGDLYLFSNAGELLGTNTTRSGATSHAINGISISEDGFCIAVVSPRAVYLLNRTSHLLWERLNETRFEGRFVSISASCDLIAAAGKYELYLLHSGGETLWRYSANGEISAFAASGNLSTIVAGTEDGRVIVLDRSGRVTGTFSAGNRLVSLAVSQDGDRILASTFDGRIYLLDSTARVIERMGAGRRGGYVALDARGDIGAATASATLHLISTTESGTFSSTTPGTTPVPEPPVTAETTPIPRTQTTAGEESPAAEEVPGAAVTTPRQTGVSILLCFAALALALLAFRAVRGR